MHSTVDNISKSTFLTLKNAYKMHKRRFIFCSLNPSYNKKNYSSGVIILNLFRGTPINRNNIKLQSIHIRFLVQEHIYMQMQQFSLHFPSPSSDLGKSLSTKIMELVLDMTRNCPFIFQTTASPSNFRVPDFFMTVHLQLFQILLLFHGNNNDRL